MAEFHLHDMATLTEPLLWACEDVRDRANRILRMPDKVEMTFQMEMTNEARDCMADIREELSPDILDAAVVG